MDEIVKAALRKWPNVPHCFGWLALDARGDWYMRDQRTQDAGPFPQVKGSRVEHDKLREFIARNYAADEAGAWFFQNGPQRVYVELEAAPLVWRVRHTGESFEVRAHTGTPSGAIQSSWMDQRGRLFLCAEAGFGLVHSLDIAEAAEAVQAGLWQPQELAFEAMPVRFGYVLQPRPR